jgi:hypothetical protein
MKRLAIMLGALSIVSPAFSAGTTAEQLVQACQSLKRQADRSKCLEEAVRAAASQAPAVQPQPAQQQPSAKELALSRAEKAIAASDAIQSVVASGISLLQYQPYVQQLSIALDQYRSVAQLQEEKDAASFLGEALQAYSDAGTYWQADISFYSYRDNRIAYGGAQPTGLTGTGWILDRYSISRNKSDIWGIYNGAPLNSALTTIWWYAKDKTQAAKDAVSRIESASGASEKKG